MAEEPRRLASRSTMRARWCAGLAWLAAMCGAGRVHADEAASPIARSFVLASPGYLYTKANGRFPTGHGIELSLHGYRKEIKLDGGFGLGLFGQLQSFEGTARYAGGLQAGVSFLGAEAGVSHRGAGGGEGPATSWHVGTYVSFVVLNLGFRWDIPAPGTDGGAVVDRAFFVGLKWPFCVIQRGSLDLQPHVCRWLVNTPG